MEQVKPPAQRTATSAPPSPKWQQMTRNQKVIFVLKVAACVVSFGFIYPGITSGD